jgi:hypothetical protein
MDETFREKQGSSREGSCLKPRGSGMEYKKWIEFGIRS